MAFMIEKTFSEIWEPINLSTERNLRLQLGPLDVYMKQCGDELNIGWMYTPSNENKLTLDIESPTSPPEIEWRRWIGGVAFDEIIFKPVTPDRPIVVRPEMPVSLLPRQKAKFFVGVPAFISICAGKEAKQLCEIPTSILSNTWFGESTVSGELCYGLKTTAKREEKNLLYHPFRIICPVQIKNVSSEILDIESLCLPVRHLNVYMGANRLWGNEETVEFRGKKKWGRVVSKPGPPPFDQASKLLSRAREQSHKEIAFNVFRKLIPFHNL